MKKVFKKLEILCQFRKDFLSLFTRGNDKENYLDPIDGLRSIGNILIVFYHLIIVFNTLTVPYPNLEWQKYLTSTAFAFSGLILFAIEIFFILSSFLLTYKLITKWNKNLPNLKLFLRKEYPLLIIRRAFRFWPGILFVIIILFILGEPRYTNSSYSFEFFRQFNIWFFFQNYINSEYWYMTLSPLWSISLDMQIHILLPLLLYLFYLYRKYISIYTSLSILLLISIIRNIIVFDPVKMEVISLLYRYPTLPLMTPNYQIDWLAKNYNVSFPYEFPNVNAIKLFTSKMYLPLEARFGSFIIGAMLAIKLIQSSNNNNNNKSKTFKKYFFFGLICFHLLTMIQDSNIPPSPSDFVLKLLVASSRQLFAIGQAFILFTGLCPSTHPYHSPWIKKFLSSSIWIPISKLSYFVYLIHIRIAFELIFGGPLKFLKDYSITYACLISLPIVMLISQFISCIWYVLAEKPIERTINYYFDKIQSSRIRLK